MQKGDCQGVHACRRLDGHARRWALCAENSRAVECVEVSLSAGIITRGRRRLGELGLACARNGQCWALAFAGSLSWAWRVCWQPAAWADLGLI